MPIEAIAATVAPGRSRAEVAYQALYNAILSGDLRVGEPLREEALAQQLKMSRTPVREALSRLLSERLIAPAKPRGYIVSGVTATQVFHVYAVREELEGYCLRLAARRIADEQLFELATIIDQMEEATHDAGRFSTLNMAFHRIIYAATGNPVLQRIMDDLVGVVLRFPVSAYAAQGRTEAVITEHRAILDALSAHDAPAAETAVREHLRRGQDARLAAMRRINLARVDGEQDGPNPPATET